MAIMKVLEYPNAALLTNSLWVHKIDESIITIINNMFDTMYHYNGCGLAANQIGINKKIFIMDIEGNRNKSKIFINTIILQKNNFINMNESCLSFPNINVLISRALDIKIKRVNLNNEIFHESYSGIEAQCIQHECDHLNGKTIFNYLSPIKLKLIEKLYNKKKKIKIKQY
jgi:peptide deformylase